MLEEIQLYGDQHRFLPVLADRKGFRVREIDVRQSPKDRHEGLYEPRVYARGFLDIFTVFFLVRFTKKPLRFFGMIGVSLFAVGALLVTWLVDRAAVLRPGTDAAAGAAAVDAAGRAGPAALRAGPARRADHLHACEADS